MWQFALYNSAKTGEHSITLVIAVHQRLLQRWLSCWLLFHFLQVDDGGLEIVLNASYAVCSYHRVQWKWMASYLGLVIKCCAINVGKGNVLKSSIIGNWMMPYIPFTYSKIFNHTDIVGREFPLATEQIGFIKWIPHTLVRSQEYLHIWIVKTLPSSGTLNLPTTES